MKVTRFEDLRVWQKSRVLATAVYRVSSQGPLGRDFGLRDQIRRAAVSIMSNIAEGFGRHSRADMAHFLAIARGSAFELSSQLYLAHDLGYVTQPDHDELHGLCIELSRMLIAMRSSLLRDRSHQASTQHSALLHCASPLCGAAGDPGSVAAGASSTGVFDGGPFLRIRPWRCGCLGIVGRCAFSRALAL